MRSHAVCRQYHHLLVSAYSSASHCLIAPTNNTNIWVMVFLSVVICFAPVEFTFFLIVVSHSSFTAAVSCSQCVIRWNCTERRDILDGRRCEASNERSWPVLSVPAGKERCGCTSVCVFPCPAVHVCLWCSWSSLLFNCRLLFLLPALVSAVSVAVEAILAQFSSSRTVVQKVSHCWIFPGVFILFECCCCCCYCFSLLLSRNKSNIFFLVLTLQILFHLSSVCLN